MMFGMGMVFFILGLLVVLIKSASTLLLKYEPAVEQSHKVPGTASINEDIVAAITIAVKRYRCK
ncbi:MAG: hypothetical protein A6F72_05490 [Cycloclasticus sp. symbiont of Poecilosclerida sp. N]|nr:MAG: hypothetical protein A6F72_05490 [Cycloclasticus sp. symbiont of Poecilosclerida sp. N]